ncbi:MAG: nitroreductase family protein [Bacilli bacterium]
MDAIFNRRSVRVYLDKPVEEEKIDKMLRAAMQAPSAINGQPWEFLVVQDKETLKKLAKMGPYSKMVEKAPLAFILFGNKKKMRVEQFFPQDMGAASENLLLEATQLGLGGVWLGVYTVQQREEYIKDMFEMPEEVAPFGVIVVGYPGKGQENKFVDRYDSKRVHYEKY